MRKKSNLKGLLDYAGGYKYLTMASWGLSALSALVALMPFVFIWKVIKEVLDAAPDYGNVQNLFHNGQLAVLSAVAAILIYIGVLMCSHSAAEKPPFPVLPQGSGIFRRERLLWEAWIFQKLIRNPFCPCTLSYFRM